MNEHLRALRLRRRLEEAGPVLWQMAAGIGGFSLAAGGVFGGLHPFGLSLVLGVGQSWVQSAAAGAALGYLALLDPVDSLRWLAALASALAGRWLFRTTFWPAAAAGCGTLLLVQLMLSMAGLSTPASAFATLGAAVLAAAGGFALAKTAKARPRPAAPLAGQAFPLAMLALPALCALPAGPLQPAAAVLAAAGLWLAYRGRVRDCAALCAAGAVMLTAADPDLAFAGLGVTAGCLAAAFLTPGERMGSAAVFLGTSVLCSLAAPSPEALLGFLTSAALAEAAFFALPRRWLAALPGQAEPVTESAARPRVASAVGQLEHVAQALTGIADTVDSVYKTLPKKGESYNWVMDHVAEELCRSCGQRERCWVEHYSDTVDGFLRLKPILEQQGRAALEQLPGQFCRCVHPVELCSAAGRAYTLYRSRRESRVRAQAMRSALTEQYTAMAQALGQMAGQLGQTVAPDEGKTARLSALLASLGLEPLEAQLGYDASGRLRGTVSVSRTTFSDEELTELSKEASAICHRALAPFVVDHTGPVTTLTLTEKAVYDPVFGLAAHPAKEDACGDAVQQFCDAFGNAHLLLCDGMGVGRPAAIDGTLACTLAAKLLKAGFAAESAARLVNVALALKSDEESAATLDLVSVDLYTGRTSLYKAGACPTFVVRGGKAEPVEAAGLPVGILSSVVGEGRTLTLHEKELVVLVSDGALVDGPGWICQQLELCAAMGSTPAEIARILADMAKGRASRSARPDDITVAVLALEKAV